MSCINFRNKSCGTQGVLLKQAKDQVQIAKRNEYKIMLGLDVVEQLLSFSTGFKAVEFESESFEL